VGTRFEGLPGPPAQVEKDVTIAALSPWLLLAQEATKQPADAAPAAPAAGGLETMLPGLAVIAVLFYFLVLRPQKAKDQQFRSMVDNLKDKDRVVTIGGIHGVVTNVDKQAGVVSIRIDDSTGAKIRVNASAIAKVVVDDEKESK
jgi:preprotein translocase subunit YajC